MTINKKDALGAADKNAAARKWFLKWIGGFFATFILLDMLFVYLATQSHSGVIVEKSYEIGKNYNAVIERAKQQEALGWQVDAEFTKDHQLMVSLADKNSQPLAAAVVDAHFVRPVKEGDDFTVRLSQVSAGLYTAPIDLPVNGQWIVEVKATWNDQTYQLSTRIVAQ